MRRAAVANSTSGTAVITPRLTSRRSWAAPSWRKAASPVASITSRVVRATGASTAVSTASEVVAPRPTTFFLRKP